MPRPMHQRLLSWRRHRSPSNSSGSDEVLSDATWSGQLFSVTKFIGLTAGISLEQPKIFKRHPAIHSALDFLTRSHFQLARARLRRGRCLEAREALKLGLTRCPQEPALLQLGLDLRN